MAHLTGIDPGTLAIRVVQGQMSGPLFKLLRMARIEIEPEEDVELAILHAMQRELPRLKLKPGVTRLGLTGRDLMIRYTTVPPVPLWRLRMLMDFEVADMASSSGDQLCADYNLLRQTSEDADETVLVALVKEHFLEMRVAALKGAGLPFKSGTPNCIALFNAFLAFGERSESEYTFLLDVGDRNLEMAIEKDGDLVFARNLAGGGDLFTRAIAESWSVSTEKARQLKHEYGNVTPRGRAAYSSSSEEKVANAIMGVAGQLAGMVQSTITFARSQSGHRDMQIGRVLISGGGAALKGLDAYLEQNLRVPVSVFRPEGGLDVSALPLDERDDFEAAPEAWVCALGLARMSQDADAFGLDLLPEKLATKRRFAQRTSWLIAAGAIAAVFLGWVWVDLGGESARAAEEARTARRSERRTAQLLKTYEDTVEDARLVAGKLEALATQTRNATDLLRAQRMLQASAPEAIWLRSVDVARRPVAPPGMENERKAAVEKTVVRVQGEIRQLGARVTTTFNDFVEALRADPLRPVVEIRDAPPESGGEFEITLDFEGWPETASEDAEETE